MRVKGQQSDREKTKTERQTGRRGEKAEGVREAERWRQRQEMETSSGELPRV